MYEISTFLAASTAFILPQQQCDKLLALHIHFFCIFNTLCTVYVVYLILSRQYTLYIKYFPDCLHCILNTLLTVYSLYKIFSGLIYTVINHKFTMIVNVVLNKLKLTSLYNTAYILRWNQSQLRNMDRDSKTSKFHRQIIKEIIQDFNIFTVFNYK